MTPVGRQCWRLIRDRTLTPKQRLDLAWELWDALQQTSTAVTAAFSTTCLGAAVTAYRRTATSDGALTPVPLAPEIVEVLTEVDAEELARVTWNYLTTYQSAFEIGVVDPDLDAQFDQITQAYGGDAAFMFADWAWISLSSAAQAEPDADWLAQVRTQVEEIDQALNQG